jgi:xylulokinase
MSAAAECKNILFGGHDYIAWKLTGALVTDATTASTTGLTDLSFQYAESLIKTVNLGHWLEMLPHIAPVDIPCGEVSEAAAIELGFPLLKAIPVLHCCGDAGACSLGAGAGIPGSMYGYLGTSGWVAGSFLRSPENVMRSVPGVFTLAHPDSTLVFRTGSIMTAGGNLAWAASNLVYTSRRDILLMKEVDKLARLAQTGCGGLLYLPFLTGERCPFEDPIARAAFIGISSDTTLPEMFRSIMEGVTFAMRSARDVMLDKPWADTGPLRLVGGGASSPLWPQIIANVFRQTVEVLEDSQDVGVKGAALLAGKWLGWHSTFSPGGDWLKVQQTYYPSHEDTLAFDSLFATYKEAYHSLKNIFEKLSHYRK